MSKTIAIINSGNVYAQTFLRSISGFNRIILGDCINSRRSFLRTVNDVRKSDPSVKVDHININSSILLEESIRHANTVVFFTHDYFSFVTEKNAQLQKTAEICKAYNVDKLVTINPIEFANYYNSNGFNEDIINEETKAHDEAIKTFDKTTILRSNLVFGTNSYLIRFLTQNWTEDYSPFESQPFKHYRFHPIYYNDLNDMIQMLVTDESNSFRGKKLLANGNESFSFTDIDSMIKQTYSTKKEHVEANKTLQKLLFNWQIFFNGNTHITNMNYMLNFLQNSNPQFSGFENASQALGMKPKSFREYYTHKAEKFDDKVDSKVDDLIKGEEPTDLRFPKMQSYWNVALD